MFTTGVLLLGALIGLIGGASYIRDTLRGKAKPNRVTFALWALAPFIAVAAQLQAGIGLHALMTFIVGFNPLLILIASFIGKNAQWQITRFDMACGALSIVGLVLWQITKQPMLAVVFSVIADLAAGLPTLIKAYRFPQTENWHIFLTGIINALLTLSVNRDWSFTSFGFAAYIVMLNSVLVIFIRFQPGLRHSATVTPKA